MSDTAFTGEKDDPMLIGKEHAADRLLRSQKLNLGSPYLHGEEPPSPNQVSAVLHALADHTLNERMVGPLVEEMGQDRGHLGPYWAQTSGLGRFLQRMGDWIEYREPRKRSAKPKGEG